MTKSKKLLSVLAAVLLMTVMTFTTVFAQDVGNPNQVSIHLRSDQAYARAAVTRDTYGDGYMKGTNQKSSRSSVSMIARARRTKGLFWKNCTEIALPNTGTEIKGSRANPHSGANIQWSLELRSKDNAQGCTADGTISVLPY